MNNAAKAKLLVLVCAFALTITSVIQAKHSDPSQQPQPPQGEQKGPPPAGQPPPELKNIQVLKGMPRSQDLIPPHRREEQRAYRLCPISP